MRSSASWSIFTSISKKATLPDALLNYSARLGWSFDGTQEIFTRPELIEKFSLERVNSSARQPRPGQAVLDRGGVDEDSSPSKTKCRACSHS